MRTAKEALQALHEAAFDIVLKNHDPAVGVNACRFLRKAASSIAVVGAPPARRDPRSPGSARDLLVHSHVAAARHTLQSRDFGRDLC